MDLIASINRLSTSIAQLSLRVDKFTQDVHDANKDMGDLSEKLASLEDSLDTLERDFENPAVQYAERQTRNLRKIINDCNRITKEMIMLLTTLSSETGDVLWSGFSRMKMASLQDSLEADRSAIALLIGMKQLSDSEQDRLNRAANSGRDTESMLSIHQSLLETVTVPYAKEDPNAKPGEPREQTFITAKGLYAAPTSRSNDRTSDYRWTQEQRSVRTSTALIVETPFDLQNARQFAGRSDPQQDQGLRGGDMISTDSWFADPFKAQKRMLSVQAPAEAQRENIYQIPDDWTNRQMIEAPVEKSREGEEVLLSEEAALSREAVPSRHLVLSTVSSRSETTPMTISEASVRKSNYIQLEEGKPDQMAMTTAAKAPNRMTEISTDKHHPSKMITRKIQSPERLEQPQRLSHLALNCAVWALDCIVPTDIERGAIAIPESIKERAAEHARGLRRRRRSYDPLKSPPPETIVVEEETRTEDSGTAKKR